MRRSIVVAGLLMLVLAACGARSEATGPPEINYGRDICIQCGMIIDDPRFAAVYVTADGTERKFDDLGDLVIYGRESGEMATAEVWVSDFEEETLIEAESAYYVPTVGVASPMGHGILAFADKSRAAATALALGGDVIDWDAVKALPVTDEGLVGDHHDEMEGHGHDG